MNYYIADWHYGHKNVIAYDNRPFISVDEMNRELEKRWVGRVADTDTVYVLGDMFWNPGVETTKLLNNLPGKKVLIKGNHDRVKEKCFRDGFKEITEYKEVADNGWKIILCHYPIPCFKNHYYPGCYHFYGHVHNSFEWHMIENFKRQMIDLYDKPCEMYNVGCMMPWMDYTPRTAAEIVNSAQNFQIETIKTADLHV